MIDDFRMLSLFFSFQGGTSEWFQSNHGHGLRRKTMNLTSGLISGPQGIKDMRNLRALCNMYVPHGNVCSN